MINPSGEGSSQYKLGYRPDIEGLRAVAILLVVAVHTGIPGLAGGYVGVDVFFVLSGYLITALLVQEVRNKGDLGFARFYARRLRRLLPALVLMLVCVGVLGWLLLPYDTQYRQADAGGNAAFWLSNFFFGFSNLGYFTPGAKTNLFLHTWSLGVEEQFYLIWPLLVVITAGAWSNAKKSVKPSRLKIVMPVIFVASFALCVYWSYHRPQLAFYMMPSRAWQFALGAMVFMFFGVHDGSSGAIRKFNLSKRFVSAAGWVGLLMILGSAVFLNDSITYPGAWALFPSVGAALIIMAGTYSRQGAVLKALAARPMQALGRVSYSWYLWHWPVLLLGSSVFLIHDLGGRLGLAVLSLLIASASYVLVESPIRRKKRLVSRPLLTVFASLGMMALAALLAFAWHGNITSQLTSPRLLRFAKAKWDSPVIYGMGCDSWYHDSSVVLCTFSDHHPKHTVVIMGDSITLQWLPAVRKAFKSKLWKVIAITKSSCPMVDVPMFYRRIDRTYTVCSKWRAAALKEVVKLKPDVFIFSSYYLYPFDRKQWIEGTDKILRQVSAAVGQIYIIRPTPVLPFNGPNCLAPRSGFYRWLEGERSCSANPDTARFKDVYHWLEIAARPFGNVHLLDMTRFVCPDDVCRAALHGKIVFRDEEHLTASFARSLGPEFARQLSESRSAQNESAPAGKQSAGN